MVFSSLVFLCIFLPIVYLLYCILPSVKARNVLLIIASLLFYAYGEPVYIFLMIGSTICNYFFGRLLDGGTGKKMVFVFAMIFNLAILCIFKYTDMLILTINSVLHLNMRTTGILLPIGISFYTFQAMSYVIDVYRGRVCAQKSYLKVLLYISFFPQLIAGPIVRYVDIEKQIENRNMDIENAAKGFRRFIIGLSKKVLISNVVAVAADNIFASNLSDINIVSAWLGAVAYMLQIYYDFSGYSDMAIGLSKMFGFTFLENFNYPYAADSMKEFWRRWHISLSTWFREYLYIPLGGNKKGRVRASLNRLIVFFFTGLWHGANWTFVLWGLYHGILLFIEDICTHYVNHKTGNSHKLLCKPLRHAYTLMAVCIGFVMFRADNVSFGLNMIAKMFTGWQFDGAGMNLFFRQCTPLFLFILILSVFGQFPYVPACRKFMENKGKMAEITNVITYILSVMLLALCVLSLSGGTYNPFIYFRF